MIGLISQNNICRAVLMDILSPLQPEIYRPDGTYDMLIATDDSGGDLPDIPLLTLGYTNAREQFHIATPVRPAELLHQVTNFYTTLQNQVTFENSFFLFQKNQRLLTIKSTQETFSLTEKENDLLATLADALPDTVSKEDLLKTAWRYSPDVESHTVESHIYMLRQKLGPDADSLIKSTPTGYTLATD